MIHYFTNYILDTIIGKFKNYSRVFYDKIIVEPYLFFFFVTSTPKLQIHS